MDLDELHPAPAVVAERTGWSGPSDPASARRATRARRRAVVLAAAAVALIVTGTVTAVGPGGGSSGPDDPPPGPVQPLEGPVWADGDGIHLAGRTFDVPRSDLVSLSLVRRGVVLHLGNGTVYLQGPDGEAQGIGVATQFGPVGDPNGSMVAWFAGSNLVVYDTDRMREVTHVPVSGVYPRGWRNQPILEVRPERVRYAADGAVWDLVLAEDGEPTPVRTPLDLHALIDSAGGVDLVAADGGSDDVEQVSWAEARTGTTTLSGLGPLHGRVSLSPDGRYVASATGPTREERLVVLDVATGEEVPLRMPDGWWLAPTTTPWSWTYGDTLTVATAPAEGDRSARDVLVCDMEQRACQPVDGNGRPLTLPN
jgi:hypothetical protein